VRARTGEEALACLASTTPAVLVVALHLPDMSGMELLRQIRAEERLAGMEVIITGAPPLSTKMRE
jgi:DNA-binding response OmpR family regulator